MVCVMGFLAKVAAAADGLLTSLDNSVNPSACKENG